MPRGCRVLWKGKAQAPTDAQLAALHQSFQANHGWTPVGAPLRRTWGDGAVAAALYREALVSLLWVSGWCYVTAMVRGVPNVSALRSAVSAALLLTDETVVEDEADL